MDNNEIRYDNQKIVDVEINKEVRKAFLDYSMSVIVSRALPDVRDGLKPVHRRILYTMFENNLYPDRAYRKCADTVGAVLGRYHPHGDASVYDAMVRLAQTFSMRYTLVDGHGNFGTVDGDPAAAYRYTESRMSKISMKMLQDIDKDTVDFASNYDDRLKEPEVLPARYPNLLVNGSSGIAVGMATNIPPHNLREVIDGMCCLIDNPDVGLPELMQHIKGPDFPTAGIIMGARGIRQAYETGRGKIYLRARAEIVESKGDRYKIVVTELPYQVRKAALIASIAELARDKKIEGVADIKDFSSRKGMHIEITVKRDANAQVVLNNLYKMTQMQVTFGVIMLALVDGVPRILSLKEMLQNYIAFQEEIITRRTRYDLKKAQDRAHILEGLLKALDNIDEVIRIIRASQNVQIAKQELMERFELTDVQAQAIVDMRLRALTGLEREKLENEHQDLVAKIAELKAILADEKLLLGVIKTEMSAIAEKYGDDRRSKIGYDELDISMEDLIPKENTIIAMTSLGYIKRMTVDNFKAQNRGGRGIKGMQTIDEDYIEDLLMTTTHHYLNFFTNMGRVYRLKAYEIPEAGRTARGTAIVNLLQLAPGEKITAMIPIHEYSDDKNLFMVTKTGIVKKTPLMEFSNVRKNGLTAINLREEDELIEVKITDCSSEIFLVTKQGMCIRFQETDVRATGRASMGVIGMNLSPGDEIIGMQLQTQGSDLLIVSENGMGKRTNMDEFTVQKRGGKGVKCYKIVEKTGDVVGAKAVNDDNEIMMITTEGIIIQLRVQDISTLSRITSGVKLINLDEGVKVAQIAKVREKLSNGDHEFDNLEEAMEEVAQEAVSEDEEEAEENLIFPTEDSEDDE